ncbi:hypothetical protein [Streptomyces sp. NEAU-W12]|uniref:hypothetical protein n=1 Tax=Streptomyces sp. NEAU-W12 TaxID=2994668 RepID=UPI00224B3CF6|nr:hypothetical protein [Streptomyces sp. NEAU-W12]MCX2924883.1 hypothetical protein [Streptomyces sp. NEAU-W12]
MWPGNQPPGGEQNPQSSNPYQQPGYQQPNPYQQPGAQQPNPYAQPQPQPQQWGTPATVGMPQPPQGGGGGKQTKIVAAVAAAAVVVTAGVTGFLVLGGDKDDTADKRDAKPSVSASEKPSTEPSSSASGSDDNPRGGDAEKATVPGWQVVTNTRFGTKFDVPADWEIEDPGTSVGFEWEEKDGELDRTTVTAPAYLKSKWCTSDDDKDGREDDTALVTAGTRGENGAKTSDQAAETRVPWWIYGGYTQPDKKSVKSGKPKAYTTASGIKGSVVTAHSENTPQNGTCDSEGKAITFGFKNGAGDFVTWNLYGAKGVEDEIPEETVQKILSTVRLTEEAPTES